MIKIRKHNSLRGLVNYVFKCSTRSWELYFLESRLGLAIGNTRTPLKPFYNWSDEPIRFNEKLASAAILEIKNEIPSEEDIVLPPELDSKLSTLDMKFEQYFKTSDKEYSTFLAELALGVMELYMPSDKELDGLGGATALNTSKRLIKVQEKFSDLVEEIEGFLEHEPLNALIQKHGNESKALTSMIILNQMWRDWEVENSFQEMQRDIKAMFEKVPRGDGGRNFGIMVIYYVVSKYMGKKSYKSIPASVEDFPFHDGGETKHMKPTEELFCQFLTYQIISLFSVSPKESFSRISTLKYKQKDDYPPEIMEIFTEEYVDELFDYFETKFYVNDSYSFERPRLEMLSEVLSPYLSELRKSQPLNQNKLEQIAMRAKGDAFLMKTINDGRLALPRK